MLKKKKKRMGLWETDTKLKNMAEQTQQLLNTEHN